MKSSPIQKYPDGVDVLVCKILIWEPGDINTIEVADPVESRCITLTECESIEIEESYKKLIGTATVKLPKGTVIRRTITADQIEKDGATTVYTERLADGAIIERRANMQVAKPEDFAVGQRIRIYLGYYRDDGTVYASASDKRRAMELQAFGATQTNLAIPDFDGYIVKCSASTPIEIRCENLASALKRKNCRDIITGNNATVNDFLQSGGKYDLLKGTGLQLHPDTAAININIGKVQLSSDLTVADLLTEWSKYKLYCFVRRDEQGVPYIQVGRSYFSAKSKESIVNNYGSSDIPVIQFDYHVAKDDLTLMNTDPKYLAVAAEGFMFDGGKEKKYSITLRLNPEWTGPSDTEHPKFQLLNETKLSVKMQKLYAIRKTKVNDRVDLSQYTVIPYTARKIGITEDELIEEAKAYFEGYNMNGIEGSLVIFGDKYNTNIGMAHLQSGMKVELIDSRHPEKNGWYLVDEVNTKFGVNGYRQTIRLPYCIARPEQN